MLLLRGQELSRQLNTQKEEFQKTEIDAWNGDVEERLAKLGAAYLARFRSGDGLPMSAMYYFPNQDERNKYRSGMRRALARLTEIVAELSQ